MTMLVKVDETVARFLPNTQNISTANSLDEVRKACAKATAAARRQRKAGNGKRGSSKT